MSDIVWEDPPEAKYGPRSPGRLRELVDQLRAHPGKWALVKANAPKSGTTNYYLRDRYGCEVVQRSNADGTFNIYARWPEEAAS